MTVSVVQKVRTFFAAYPLHTFEKRELILRPDEPLSAVFYIVEGLVSQYDITRNGNEVVVNVFKPGAFFPMSTALNNTPNAYFFEASTPLKVHVATPAAVVQFLNDNPDVAMDLLSRVYRGVDGVLRRMTHLMGGSAKHRLLFELLNTTYRFGETQPDGSIFVPVKEGDIGRLSGLARETVNRNMQALKMAGLVIVKHHGMIITDIKRLEQVLGSNI
jgi:CRP-like cAMP-binding protein